MFAYENFILTSTTTLPGTLLTIFVTYVLAQIPLMESSFYFPWYLFAAVVLVLYLVNIIIGILPIRRMLKLPPAQLAAKYDI
jgi:ABC-type antimicrobial peptide transport system permease subunit